LAGQYFYLEETMDKESAILPKVINFRISNEQIDFCGDIEPIGLRFTLGLHIINNSGKTHF
jgi:hypothetical protein